MNKPGLRFAGSPEDPTSAQAHKHPNPEVLDQITQEMVTSMGAGGLSVGVLSGGKPNTNFSIDDDVLSGGRP